MHGVIGLFVAVAAVFAYSATGWIYSESQSHVAAIGSSKFVQQNFDNLSQRSIRKQIVECLRDSYQYLAMSMFFDQADVALPGFQKMFKDYSDREMSNAVKLMNYMNLREGSMKLREIPEPLVSGKWSDGETALYKALDMEKKANVKFLTVLKLALDKHDPHLKQFLEGNFLDQKVQVIKDLGDKLTQLQRYKKENPGLGLQFFDNTLL